MPNVNATLDALYALQEQVGADQWRPEEVRRRRLENGFHELVLVDPATEKVRVNSPTVRFRPTVTDRTHVAEIGG